MHFYVWVSNVFIVYQYINMVYFVVFAFVSLGTLHVLYVENDTEKLSMNAFIQYDFLKLLNKSLKNKNYFWKWFLEIKIVHTSYICSNLSQKFWTYCWIHLHVDTFSDLIKMQRLQTIIWLMKDFFKKRIKKWKTLHVIRDCSFIICSISLLLPHIAIIFISVHKCTSFDCLPVYRCHQEPQR